MGKIFINFDTILQDNFYVVGGRRFSHRNDSWEYQTRAQVFKRKQNTWFDLPDLPVPIGKQTKIRLSINCYKILELVPNNLTLRVPRAA
jgi:hypothetical protein